MEQGIKKKTPGIAILKSLLVSYILTGILLLILALLLFKFDFDKGKITVGIIVVYILSSFMGGFVIGKSQKNRKFLWGMALGCVYFVILTGISFLINRGIQGDFIHMATTCVMCVGGGTLGGMIS